MESFFKKKVKDCIEVLQRYLPPEGITQGEAIGELLGLLDNAEIVEALREPQPVELNFDRPICFIDLETTGVDIEKDRIVEISVIKVAQDRVLQGKKTVKINPGFPIPEEAIKVHGITDEMVKDCPKFEQIAKSLFDFILGCDIIGFNSTRFDVPFLENEFRRVGIKWQWKMINLVDVRNIYVRKEERNLAAAVKFYLGRDHQEAHSAEADITATMEILYTQLGLYADLPTNMKDLALFSNYDNEILDLAGRFKKNDKGEVVFAFGKHLDKVANKEPDYLHWMLKPTSTFTQDTKDFARSILYSL